MAKRTLNYNQSRALGSLLLQQLNNQKPAPNKAVKETPAQEFDRIKREHDDQFVTIEVPTSAYEKSISGRATKQIEVSRADYENRMGIAGLRKIWACSPDKLQSMAENPRMRLDMVDSCARWPLTSTPFEMTEESAEKISQQAKDFFDSTDLADDNRNRVVLFVGLNSDADSRIDVTNPEIWQVAHDRLQFLGAMKPEAESQPTQPTQVEQTIAELNADEFRTEAEQRWFAIWEDTWNSWLDSMAQTWGFYPSKTQSRAAIDLLLKLESYGDGRFDECRRRLTMSGVFKPGMLTALEQLESRVDAGEFGDLSTQMGKQRYAAAFNRVKFGSEA